MRDKTLTTFLNGLHARLKAQFERGLELDAAELALLHGKSAELAVKYAGKMCRGWPTIEPTDIASEVCMEIVEATPGCLNIHVQYTTYLFQVVHNKVHDARNLVAAERPLECASERFTGPTGQQEFEASSDRKKVIQRLKLIVRRLTRGERIMLRQVSGKVSVAQAPRWTPKSGH